MRRLFHLLSDVQACTRPVEQARTLVDGMCALVGAELGWFVGVERDGDGWRPIAAGQGTTRDPTIDRFIASWGTSYPIHFDLMATSILADPRTSFVKQWDEIRREAPLRRFGPFCDLVTTIRVADMIDPCYSDRPGRYFAMNLQRRGGGRRFVSRDRALLQLASREMRWLTRAGRLPAMGTPRADEFADLPPRLRQVMRAMLTGAPPKRIARAMGLSVWTVREHVQRLYRHYGVNGREELMARFVGP